MTVILVDHNMEGQAVLLWDALKKTGIADLIPLEMLMFADAGLPDNSSDREVWRFVQTRRMMLLTDNRSDNEEDSLEQTIREENRENSLPVLTIGNLNRVKERHYRERCAEQIAEIVLELDNFLGCGRIFVP